MKSVICFGEALIDFLNTGNQEDGCLMLQNYRQYPGGAPANAAVAVAKLGGNALFAGQVGEDPFGDFLESSLQAYHVNTQFLYRHPKAKTALAFVMLDQYGERTFSFHRHETADVLFTKEQVSDEWFTHEVIFHFCSNTLTEKGIASSTKYAVSKALSANSIVSFDVNLRHNLWPEAKADINLIKNLIRSAHIIKFSLDEFDYLAQGDADNFIEFCFNWNGQLIIITDGAKAITYYTKGNGVIPKSIQPPTVSAIDTTAGGDGFIGGFLYALSQFNTLNEVMYNELTLDRVIQFSAQCGAIAVSKLGAFPALATLDNVLPLLNIPYNPSSQSQKATVDLFLRSN
ncbi:MAG: carbohydrate kinase [Colwellia sp.]|nr:carbohydrate kinase [Colwellia sp.]